jgi:hypothetical protein
MDAELRQYLEGMESRMESRFDAKLAAMDTRFDAKLEASFIRWSQFILHEMGVRFSEVDRRLESIEARLKLQAGLIQSGARAMARFSEFAENSEERWVSLAGRVAELERKMANGKSQ